MNTSRKTKIVAEGIALWAAVQDFPGINVMESPEGIAWHEWANVHKDLVALVQREQYNLFDRLLNS